MDKRWTYLTCYLTGRHDVTKSWTTCRSKMEPKVENVSTLTDDAGNYGKYLTFDLAQLLIGPFCLLSFFPNTNFTEKLWTSVGFELKSSELKVSMQTTRSPPHSCAEPQIFTSKLFRYFYHASFGEKVL